MAAAATAAAVITPQIESQARGSTEPANAEDSPDMNGNLDDDLYAADGLDLQCQVLHGEPAAAENAVAIPAPVQ